MKKQSPHLSPELIGDFVNGPTQLSRREFRHLQDCDECSRIWWGLTREAKGQNSEEAKKKAAA